MNNFLEEKTHEKYKCKINDLQQENQVKEEELVMKNKEIELLHSNFEKKFSQFEIRNEELETQIDFKEREYMEEKFRREELENEVKRYKEEIDDIQAKEAIEVKYGFKDSYLANAQMPTQDPGKQEKTDDTYCIESKNYDNDFEYDNIYGKLSSELTNLRNEINNLKSERGSSNSTKKENLNRNKSRGVLEYTESQNFKTYYKKNFNNATQEVLSQRKENRNPTQKGLKFKVHDSNFSEIDKLNALEQRLNDQNVLDEALNADSESEIMSYRQSEFENINNEIDPQYFGQSENQSPNQESYRQQISAREHNKLYWEMANGMEKKEEEAQNVMVPSLNMERVHSQLQ